MDNHSDNELETHDMYFAAYLLLAKCTIKSTRSVGHRKYWTFHNKGGSVIELRNAYYDGSATGSLHEFVQKIVGMKNLCHDPLNY